MEEIIKDLDRRALKTLAFICEDEGGKIQVLAYKDELVYFVSALIDRLELYEGMEGSQIRNIGSISTIKQTEK